MSRDKVDFFFFCLIQKQKIKKKQYFTNKTINISIYIANVVIKGIPPHVDTHSAFADAIISLSLASDVVMEFRKPSIDNSKEYVAHVPVTLPRRSLLIMAGESRYGWKHGITPRKIDVIRNADGHLTTKFRAQRISYTFRW